MKTTEVKKSVTLLLQLHVIFLLGGTGFQKMLATAIQVYHYPRASWRQSLSQLYCCRIRADCGTLFLGPVPKVLDGTSFVGSCTSSWEYQRQHTIVRKDTKEGKGGGEGIDD